MLSSYDLSFVLICFNRADQLRLEDLVRGVLILGSTGSGKSSGSGKYLFSAFARARYCIFTTCPKKEDAAQYTGFLRACGRERDIIRICKGGDFRLNIFDYEWQQGGGEVHNLIELFMVLYALTNRNGGGRADERFWESMLRQMLRMVIVLCIMSEEVLTPRLMIRIIGSIPSFDRMQEENFLSENLCFQLIDRVRQRYGEDHPDFLELDDYFFKQMPMLEGKTRGIVMASVTGILEPFTYGLLEELFARDTTFTPEEVFTQGKCVIVDIPVETFKDVGTISQAALKYIFQRAVQRRNVQENPIPVVFFLDEAQQTLNRHDAEFLSTCRSCLVIVVMLTQNIPSFYVAMGGDQATARTNMLVGNLNTKIFHASNDYVTNEWAANTIGRTRKLMGGFSSNSGQGDVSASMSEQLHYQIEPLEFSVLRTGGKSNGYEVDGIVTTTGRPFSNGKNFLQVSFDQRGSL